MQIDVNVRVLNDGLADAEEKLRQHPSQSHASALGLLIAHLGDLKCKEHAYTGIGNIGGQPLFVGADVVKVSTEDCEKTVSSRPRRACS